MILVEGKKKNSDENKSIPQTESIQTEKEEKKAEKGLFCLPYSLPVVLVVFIYVVVVVVVF
jgi:hypothetical protein